MPSTALVELKKRVKEANDIVDVVASYVTVQPAGKIFKCLCPFHNDTRPSLQINKEYQNFRCWSCDSRGDIFDFVMKFEKVNFPEAMRILANRAGIKLEADTLTEDDKQRAQLLQVLKWAEDQFREYAVYDEGASIARQYLAERKLLGPTIKQFGLGFAPVNGDWLCRKAEAERLPPDLLVQTGLIAPRDEGRGYYDRFRERVIFPIRDVRGQTVGFGGRILPTSALAARGPKYYNTAETTLFKKQELIYGLDMARHAGSTAGYLAIVEGYTDVMMAHQCGLQNVVATMGTALNMTHVMQLRRYVPKVVLVFDSDDAGESATDKSQGLFWAQHNFDIAVCTLPQGLDPCDLLMQPGGTEVFKKCLAEAKDVHEFKIDSLLRRHSANTLEGQKYIVDASLSFLALAESPSAAAQMKIELAVTRLAQRLQIRQETVWARLGEMRNERRRKQAEQTRSQPGSRATSVSMNATQTPPASGKADKAERQLLEILLADPALVAVAHQKVPFAAIQHTGLQRLLQELYTLFEVGMPPDLDALRVRLLDRPDLAEAASRMQDVGRGMSDRATWLERVLKFFDEARSESAKAELKTQLAGEVGNDEQVALLRRIMAQTPQPHPKTPDGPRQVEDLNP
ncbi:MAG: DNA primase [Fimbriiglobus sp.]